MKFYKFSISKFIFSLLLCICFSSASAQTGGGNQFVDTLNDADKAAFHENLQQNGFDLGFGAVGIGLLLDPANHQCCTPEPPDEVQVEIENGVLIITTANDPDHWFNFSATCDETTTSCSGETSITLAGFDDVRNTFSCDMYGEGVQCDVVLGADGELFDETLEYTLLIDLEDQIRNIIDGNPLTQSVPLPADPVPEAVKVNTVGGSRNADFGLGAYSDNGTPAYGNSFSASEFITIYGEVTPDPVDVGKDGELFAAVLSVVGGKATFSSINMDGNFVVWDLTIGGLEPIQQAMPLQSSHQLKLFEGNLQAGVHKVTFAYMAEEGPIVYMKPITVQVSE